MDEPQVPFIYSIVKLDVVWKEFASLRKINVQKETRAESERPAGGESHFRIVYASLGQIKWKGEEKVHAH